VIYPLYGRYTNGQNEADRLRDEKTAHEMEVSLLPTLRERNAEAHAKFDAMTQDYPELIPDEDIVSMLNDMCNRNNLRPAMLRLTHPKPPSAVIIDEEYGEPAEDAEMPPVFTIVSAAMNVTGDYPSLLRLLDEVNSIQYIRLASVNYVESRHETAAGTSNMSLDFEITFLTPE